MQKVVGLVGLRGSGKDTAAQFLVAQGWRRVAFADALYKEAAKVFGVTVEFLQRRDTKELPLPELALVNCQDQVFVGCFLAYEEKRLARERASLQEARSADKITWATRVIRWLLPGRQQHSDRAESHTPSMVEMLSSPRSPREILQVWGTEYRRKMYSDDYWRKQVQLHIQAHPDDNFVITDVRFPDEASLVVDDLGGELGRMRRPGLGGSTDKALLHASEVAMLDYPIAREFINTEGDAGLAALRMAITQAFL